ncbi:uncharacterized protein [Miscanthus floridulus]|uniref:uncharacterized protein n=1 Tax=Miscanthus floridulus TaxID=154761 RepID=UPI003457EC6A
MGWVDLWRGILFSDVLSSSPTLCGVTLPLPRSLVNHGKGIEGCPKPNRGIAVIQGCLRMVELEVHIDGLPMLDPETGHLNFGVHDWEPSTYTNRKISGAWEDWQLDCTAKASHIDIDEAMQWQLLQSGLLHVKQEGREQKLKNLHTSQPVLSLDNNGAVYLLTKVKFLLLTLRAKKIQSLAEFSTERNLGRSHAYCPSSISSYINARATPGNILF